MISKLHLLSKSDKSVVEVHTTTDHWVVPHNCEYLKLLISQQNLVANDLQFDSAGDCKGFIRQLFLLALEDEHKNYTPSLLADFARDLAKIKLEQTTL